MKQSFKDLKACFDLTDWSVFETAANDLDELTESVTSYMSPHASNAPPSSRRPEVESNELHSLAFLYLSSFFVYFYLSIFCLKYYSYILKHINY